VSVVSTAITPARPSERCTPRMLAQVVDRNIRHDCGAPAVRAGLSAWRRVLVWTVLPVSSTKPRPRSHRGRSGRDRVYLHRCMAFPT